MPLVQSLDILRQRVTNPLLKSVLDDVYERVRAGSSLSEAFEAQGTLFPGVYTASLLAGEKSGSLEQVHPPLRGLREGHLGGQAQDDFGARLPGDPARALVCGRRDHRLKVVPEFGAFYNQFGKELPLSTRIIVSVSNFAVAYFFCHRARHRRRRRRPLVAWLRRPGNRRRFDRWILGSRCSGRSRRSSQPRKRRGRWPRCSAAAFRSSTRSTSRRGRSATSTWRTS